MQSVKIWAGPYILQVIIKMIFLGPDISLSEGGFFLALCASGFYAFLWYFEGLFKLCALVHP